MMRDPLTWSFGVGRWFGVQVRIHILFVLFAIFTVYRFASDGLLSLGLAVMGLWWLSVLLHEFGHCFGARWVGGQADEILMWPLGGLAFVEVGNSPRPQMVVTLAGPAVNVVLCVGTAFALLTQGAWGAGQVGLNPLSPPVFDPAHAVLGLLAYGFWMNWVLLLVNLLPAFPLDGGRLLRCFLWSRSGFGRATLICVQVAKVLAIGLGLTGLIWSTTTVRDDGGVGGMGLVVLAVFIYVMAERERQLLEAGLLFDDSVFGYDFSQGYTSLEKSSTKLEEKSPSAWRRWRVRRARLKRDRELARQREEERRVDELLARVYERGMESLTENDRRFLYRASARYRSRMQPPDR